MPTWGPCNPLQGGGGGEGAQGGDNAALEEALALLGYADLGVYQAWLSNASDGEALVSAWLLHAVLLGLD